jgi:hypothetical protein
MFLMRSEKLEEAEGLCRRSLAIRERHFGQEHLEARVPSIVAHATELAANAV